MISGLPCYQLHAARNNLSLIYVATIHVLLQGVAKLVVTSFNASNAVRKANVDSLSRCVITVSMRNQLYNVKRFPTDGRINRNRLLAAEAILPRLDHNCPQSRHAEKNSVNTAWQHRAYR